MGWEPESFTPLQRRAASKAIGRAQVLLDNLDRREFGAHNIEAVSTGPRTRLDRPERRPAVRHRCVSQQRGFGTRSLAGRTRW